MCNLNVCIQLHFLLLIIKYMLLIKWLLNIQFPAKLTTLSVFHHKIKISQNLTTTKHLNCIPAQQRTKNQAVLFLQMEKSPGPKQVPKQTPGQGGKRNWHTKAYKNLSVLGSSASNRVKMTRSALMLYIFANNEDSSSRR